MILPTILCSVTIYSKQVYRVIVFHLCIGWSTTLCKQYMVSWCDSFYCVGQLYDLRVWFVSNSRATTYCMTCVGCCVAVECSLVGCVVLIDVIVLMYGTGELIFSGHFNMQKPSFGHFSLLNYPVESMMVIRWFEHQKHSPPHYSHQTMSS